MPETTTVRAYPFWIAWANRPSRAIGVALALSLATVLGTLLLEGHAEVGWRAATRYTARISFPLFLIAFLASSIARLWPGPRTRALVARRRALGLAFATAHLVHGVTIFVTSRFDPETLALRPSVIGGSIGYALLVAMVATSNDSAQRALGPRAWTALHRTGQIVLFGIFSVSYLGRFGRDASYWPSVSALGAALAIRLAAAFQSRRLRSRTLPIE